MLDEGARRRDRGTDVVIGFVETHGRPHDRGPDPRPVESSPRRQIAYRDGVLEEMDVDGDPRAPPRRSRSSTSWRTPTFPAPANEKRWQDIEALLDAGIERRSRR